MDDLYQILGVSRTATEREIRSAFRRLARQHHPDVSQAPEAKATFQKVAEAYQVLGDPQSRRLYDRGEYIPRRGGRRSAQPEVDPDRERAQRAAAYNSRINRVVDEIIEEERREMRKRADAISVVATLFASAFVVAAARPSTVEPFGIVGHVLVFMIACVAFWQVVKFLREVLSNYTYSPDFILSITSSDDSPHQPFTRASAVVFLALGYVIAIVIGNAIGSVTFVIPEEKVTFLDMVRTGLVYPPIAVCIVVYFRRIGQFLDEW